MALLDQFLSGFSVQNEFAPQDQQEALLANLFRQIQASQAAPAQQPTPAAPASGAGAPQIGEAQALPVGVQVPRGPDPLPITDWQTTGAPEPAPPAGGNASVGIPAADYQPPRDLPVREEPKTAGAPYAPPQSAPMPMGFGHILPGPETARTQVASAPKAGGRTWQQMFSDFGDALQGKDVPDREMQNQTAEAIAKRFPELAGLAPSIVRDPQSLRAILPSVFSRETGSWQLGEITRGGQKQKVLVNSRTAETRDVGDAATDDGRLPPGYRWKNPSDPRLGMERTPGFEEKPRQFAPKDLKDLGNEGKQLSNTRRFLDTFDPSYAGYMSGTVGEAATWAGRNLPDGMVPDGIITPKASQWWQDYKRNSELIERHELFGAALTPGEQAQWQAADIGPGMQPETIKANLATRKALLEKGMRTHANSLIQAGYDPAPIAAAYGIDLNELGVTTERQRGATSIGAPGSVGPATTGAVEKTAPASSAAPDKATAIAEARRAIAAGKDPAAVAARLRQWGYEMEAQ
jgi:hypothetical protein